METKHTQKPWALKSKIAEKGMYPAYELSINFISSNAVDCISVFCCEETPTERELATAYLVAAAPELLEALERSLNDFRNSTWTEETYKIVEQAIKKAKGE